MPAKATRTSVYDRATGLGVTASDLDDIANTGCSRGTVARDRASVSDPTATDLQGSEPGRADDANAGRARGVAARDRPSVSGLIGTGP